MKYLDLSWPEPAENLACDEAFLLEAEDGGGDEVLRVWEPRETFVVVGHGSRVEREVALAACRGAGVRVLRRPSGGAAVVQAPGCLNYALILRIGPHGLTDVAATNCYVMKRVKNALEPLVGAPIAIDGFTDLTVGGRKFSGNAQYRKKRALLFHGSLLLDCDIATIQKLLLDPPRQPAYRRRRPHEEFLMNLQLPAAAVKAALREAWGAVKHLDDVPHDQIATVAERRYTRDEWTFRL
ncbi:MAG TPA: lipoate--protein ligase family protein [Verrucomicrobiae bacterium]|nr:lipoate--protein ligase family protein [Verrucomicrobiae bacterium]